MIREMHPIKYGESDDGKIEYVSLTRDKLEDALYLIKTYFPIHENNLRAINFAKNPLAVEERFKIWQTCTKDGISIVAVQKSTGKVVGYSFNKIQHNNPNSTTTTADLYSSLTQPECIVLNKWIQKIDSSCNLFSICNVDLFFDVMYVGVLPEFWGKRIGCHLIENSLKLAKRLCAGEDVRVPVNDEELPPKTSPTVACAIFTSHKTQKIGRRLGFKIAARVPVDGYVVDGRKVEFDPETAVVEVVYKELN